MRAAEIDGSLLPPAGQIRKRQRRPGSSLRHQFCVYLNLFFTRDHCITLCISTMSRNLRNDICFGTNVNPGWLLPRMLLPQGSNSEVRTIVFLGKAGCGSLSLHQIDHMGAHHDVPTREPASETPRVWIVVISESLLVPSH